jgi:hypothetical protein
MSYVIVWMACDLGGADASGTQVILYALFHSVDYICLTLGVSVVLAGISTWIVSRLDRSLTGEVVGLSDALSRLNEEHELLPRLRKAVEAAEWRNETVEQSAQLIQIQSQLLDDYRKGLKEWTHGMSEAIRYDLQQQVRAQLITVVNESVASVRTQITDQLFTLTWLRLPYSNYFAEFSDADKLAYFDCIVSGNLQKFRTVYRRGHGVKI